MWWITKKLRRRPPRFAEVVRITGLGIAIYETLFDHVDRPSILILAGGMMGLDSVLKAQRYTNGDDDASSSPSGRQRP